MTTQKEALKLAREVLGEDRAWLESDAPQRVWDANSNAMIAIDEALAQQCVCGEPNSAGTHRTDGPCLAPQRTWEGLSVFEINDLVENTEYEDYRGLVEITEAKLKEKNT